MGEPDDKESFKNINLRGKLWKIICNIDQLKNDTVEKFNSNHLKEKLNIKSSVMVN